MLGADLLGRDVVECAHRLPGSGDQARLVILGQAEVGHERAAALVEEDVRGLEVAVDQPVLVESA